MLKKIMICIFAIVVAIIGVFWYLGYFNSETRAISGKWYTYGSTYEYTYEFSRNGHYKLSNTSDGKDVESESGKYKYDSGKNTIYLSLDDRKYKITTSESGKMILTGTTADSGDPKDLYRDPKKSPDYYSVDKNTDEIMDDDGFCIKDGILYAYRGKAKEVTVPSDVKRIYYNAFSGDCNHGVNLVMVTVPGTVKTVDNYAFAFTSADYITFREGVKVLGNSVFSDAYVKKVHFPESLTKIGNGIMDTEEGLSGARIYVKKGSLAYKYFKGNPPYGDFKLIVE